MKCGAKFPKYEVLRDLADREAAAVADGDGAD
jgi:hypothetical protein